MALEDLVGPDKFITNLVPSNPPGTDDPVQIDDHMRGVKNVQVNTFPNLNGAVLCTPEALNQIALGEITLNKPTVGTRFIKGQTNEVNRNTLYISDAAPETGANAGSNFQIESYADNGTFLRSPLIINRAAGHATFSNNLSCGGLLYQGGELAASIGVGQAWQNMSGLRDINIIYTNDTGRPIKVSIVLTFTANTGADIYINGLSRARIYSPVGGANFTISEVIPAGNTYNCVTDAALFSWHELR